MIKFRKMVWSQAHKSPEVNPLALTVPNRLMSGTMVQTVKVWMHRIIKMGRSPGWTILKAKYLAVFPAIRRAIRKPTSHSKGKAYTAW